MDEITNKTLGHPDILHCVVSRLAPWDVVAFMFGCKRLKELGIEWLKIHGRAWVPDVNIEWTFKELRLAALWAFGTPKQIYRIDIRAVSDADVSEGTVWVAGPSGVIIHDTEVTKIDYPPLFNQERPRINVYTCGGEAVGMVSVGGKLGLVRKTNRQWITLCNKPSYYVVDSRTDAKWIITTRREQEGVVFFWANLRNILKTGRVVWRSSPVSLKLIGDAHVLPNLHFTGTDALVILKLLASNEETARLSLISGKWSKQNRGVKHPVWQTHWGEPVCLRSTPHFRLRGEGGSLLLRRHGERYNPVIRTFSGTDFFSIHNGTKIRALSFNGKALIYVQSNGYGRLFSLTPTGELTGLQDVIRASRPLPIIEELVKQFRMALNQIDQEYLFVGALSGDWRPLKPSNGELHGRLQRLLVLAIEAGRPDICTLLVAELVPSMEHYSLAHAFEYACGKGQLPCALALLKTGALLFEIPLAREGQMSRERVEAWTLARGVEMAIAKRLWRVVEHVLSKLEAPTEPNDLARMAILSWLYDLGEKGMGAKTLLSMLIMQMPSLLRVSLTTQLVDRTGLWDEWEMIYPIDLVTHWDKDQLEWGELCRKQESICWKLIVELRGRRQYPTLQKLILCWLDSPLAPGTHAALRSLLKLNPASHKRCKR